MDIWLSSRRWSEGRFTSLEEVCQALRIEKATLEGQLQQVIAQKIRNIDADIEQDKT